MKLRLEITDGEIQELKYRYHMQKPKPRLDLEEWTAREIAREIGRELSAATSSWAVSDKLRPLVQEELSKRLCVKAVAA